MPHGGGSVVLRLLEAVVTALADALKVGFVPEQQGIASMRNLMVGYGLAFAPCYAVAQLAGEQVTHAHCPAQPLPAL